MSSTYLKVKIKTLAAESKIIQEEEKKYPNHSPIFNSLYGHRKGIVAQEARATQIAYAFIRGIPLYAIEVYPSSIPEFIWKKVERMVHKYGSDEMGIDGIEMIRSLSNWIEEGIEDEISVREVVDTIIKDENMNFTEEFIQVMNEMFSGFEPLRKKYSVN